MRIGEAYKYRLACSVTVRIPTLYNFYNIIIPLKYLSIQQVKPKNNVVCVAMCSLVMNVFLT